MDIDGKSKSASCKDWQDLITSQLGIHSSLLEKWNLVALSKIVSGTASFCCNVLSQERKKQGCSPDDQMKHEELFVAGMITHSPKQPAAQPRHCPGTIYMEDDTAALPVKFASVKFVPYGHHILCTKWNFIRSKNGAPHVEANDWLLMEHAAKTSLSIRPVTVTTAEILLQKRAELGVGVLCVFGQVEACSEIIRVKGEPLFLVKLLDESSKARVNVILKGNQYMYWNSLLLPHQEYIFTQLKPTTIYKGTSNEMQLFTPWKNAQVFASEQCSFTTQTLQEWLNDNNCSSVDGRELTSAPLPEVHTTPSKKFYTVKLFWAMLSCITQHDQQNAGVITDNKDAAKGIYELDGKARLYLSYVPACHEYQQLRCGTSITVHNAHLKGSPQPPKTRLYCCMMGSIQVEDFSTLATEPNAYESSQCLESHLITRCSLNATSLEWLVAAFRDFSTKFRPHMKRSEAERVLYSILLWKSPVSGESLLKENVRNLVSEFLGHPEHGHSCVLRAAEGQPSLDIPTLASVMSTHQEEAQCLQQEKTSLVASNVTGAALNEQLYWNYQIIDRYKSKNQIYVGWLRMSPSTGRLELVDATGSINCVIAAEHDSTDIHQCSTTCQASLHSINRSSSTKYGTCPMMQTKYVQHAVCLTDAYLVVERFIVSNFLSPDDIGDKKCIKNLCTRIYLLCSLKDIIDLGHVSKLSRKSNKRPGNSISSSAVHRSRFPSDIPHGKRMKYMEDTELGQSNHGACGEKKDINQNIQSSVPLAEGSPDVARSHPTCASQLLFVTHKDGLNVRSRVNLPQLSSYILVCFLGSAQLITHDKCQSQRHLEDTGEQSCERTTRETLKSKAESANKVSSRLVVLSLQQDAIRWFPLLQVGGLYKLTKHNCNDIAIFQRNISQRQLYKALEDAHTKQIISVSSDMSFENVEEEADMELCSQISEIRQDLLAQGHMCDLLSVQETLSQGISSPVSFHGIVKSRNFENPPAATQKGEVLEKQDRDNARLGVSVPLDRPMRVTVQDSKSNQELPVYLTMANMSYPLGLLTGAHVAFHRVQVKQSRTGRLYAQCGIATDVSLLKLPPVTKNKGQSELKPTASKTESLDVNAFPWKLLCQLADSSYSRMFSTWCHVQTVRKLELCASCVVCSSVVRPDQCSNSSCGSRQSPVYKGSASIFVDDGTGTALVYCEVDHLQTLLGLSDIQWRDVELSVAQHGPITYTQGQTQDCCCPLCHLLKSLCESPLVQREVTMYARRSQSKANSFKSELTRKPLDIGGVRLETCYAPLLSFQCVALQPLDYRQCINQLLKEEAQE